jgi:hypothetical protein
MDGWARSTSPRSAIPQARDNGCELNRSSREDERDTHAHCSTPISGAIPTLFSIRFSLPSIIDIHIDFVSGLLPPLRLDWARNLSKRVDNQV